MHMIGWLVLGGGLLAGLTPAGTVFNVQNNAERPSDVQLQMAVSQALQNSPLTANSMIVVHVNRGEITLEGAAMSPLAKREATRLAETVLGVTDIRNRLSVVNAAPQTAETPRDNP